VTHRDGKKTHEVVWLVTRLPPDPAHLGVANPALIFKQAHIQALMNSGLDSPIGPEQLQPLFGSVLPAERVQTGAVN